MARHSTTWIVALALAVIGTVMGTPAHAAAQQGATLEGVVLTSDSVPAPNTEVRLQPLGRVMRVGPEGTYRFEDIPAGRYVVTAYNEQSGTMTEQVSLRAGETTTLELVLDPLFHLSEVFVSVAGEPVSENDLYQAASALSGRDLRSKVAASIGETLSDEPGVSSTYFGPAASRPVIRGLTGDRVRILESGVGTGDASTTSPDHAVSVEAQLADRIEIIRGPATLLYGGSAIGGVVNVLDNRVPDEIPANPVTGQFITAGGTVANERNVSGELNGGVDRFAWHVSGLFRETGDYDIPGFAEADHDEEEHEAGEHEGEEEIEGVLPNSALQTMRAAVGASYVASNGFFGASVSGYDSEYGVPGGHGHGEEEEEPGEEEEHGEEDVTIDLKQRRLDLRGGWRFGSDLLRGLKVRFGYTDYEHTELEGGEPGTLFENQEWETRVEGQTRFAERLHGAVGIQLGNRDFSAIGDEAFTPPSDTDQLGAFIFQELDLESVRLQAGARFESRDVTNTADGFARHFEDASFSVGSNVTVNETLSLALSLGHSAKQPSVEELFSDGPHLATRSFELGDVALTTETANSIDLTARIQSHLFNGEITGYVNDFSDFVYQEFTGGTMEGLPILQYTQSDALFRGVEGRFGVEVAELASHQVELELSGDYVWAELSDTEQPLPRITPPRFGAGVNLIGSPWDASVSLRRIAEQDRVAPNEEPTEGYTLLDARLGYRILSGSVVHELILQGKNLTDTEARSHVSLLKEFAPLPGRELRLMYRLGF